jgi:hypothetical protein
MRKYCTDCTSWDQGRHFYRHGNPETDGCTVEIGVDENHPIAPKTLYLNYAVANKDNKCERYKDKLEGLGLAKDVNDIKESLRKNTIRFTDGEGQLDDEKDVDEA